MQVDVNFFYAVLGALAASAEAQETILSLYCPTPEEYGLSEDSSVRLRLLNAVLDDMFACRSQSHTHPPTINHPPTYTHTHPQTYTLASPMFDPRSLCVLPASSLPPRVAAPEPIKQLHNVKKDKFRKLMFIWDCNALEVTDVV